MGQIHLRGKDKRNKASPLRNNKKRHRKDNKDKKILAQTLAASDIYGQDTPPEYDLTKVNVPIGLYWGENDWLAHPSVSFIKNSFLILKFTFDCKIGISGYFETFDQTPQRCAQLRSSL